MANPINVKASLKFEEHRLLQISPSSTSLETVKSDIRKSFPLLDQSTVDINLCWIDQDGDRITISSDTELQHALNQVNGRLQIEVSVDARPQHNSSHQHRSVSAALQQEYHVRNPPSESVSRIDAEETVSRSLNMPSLVSSSFDSGGIQESVARQTSSVSEADEDQLDIPDIPLFEDWPTSDTYALNMMSKLPRQHLDDNLLNDRSYDTDPGRQCRVLCIMNKESHGSAIYPGGNMDMEQTYLQQFCKKLKWQLQLYKDKTSEEIEDILNSEMERDYESCRSLFVIILTKGDRYGIYGTRGRCIEYWKLSTRFSQVESLKGKPKIFLIDDCDIGNNNIDQDTIRGIQDTQFSMPPITIPKERLRNGNIVLSDQRDCESVPNACPDTYVCKASTLRRCDKLVKGSWLVGALMSVVCKAGNRMTFQKMMTQIDMMICGARIPEGVPNPTLVISNELTKDFYLLPPPC